jgi:hypothetical protein
MSKINENIFEEVLNELEKEAEAVTVLSEIPRGSNNIQVPPPIPTPLAVPTGGQGFNIGATPGALIGALTGAYIANKKARTDALKRQIELDKHGPSLDGNYYSQAQNIVEHLKVIFTPISVIYVVKNGTKETTIDTIETSEMNKDMYAAWQHKDYNYYKNLMLTKMYSEMQVVENGFAKKFLEKQNEFQTQIIKKASVNDDKEVECPYSVDDLTDVELMEHVANAKDLYAKHSQITEKIAGVLMDTIDKDTIEYVIPLQLERPFDKYAGFTSDPISFMGFNANSKDIKAMQGKFLDPHYLSNKVKVGFMPDRVIFTADNQLMGTLLAMSMNTDGFEHFQNQDKKYFINYFNEEVKRGIMRMKGKIEANSPQINARQLEKKASSTSIKQIFERSDIHPVLYYLALTQKYGFDWFNFDPHALVKIIEIDFGIDDAIEAIPLNKILSIQVLNNSETPYVSYHAFEKVIRGLCGKRIDFFKREISDMDIDDIAFAIDVMDRVTPHDDIYDNFGPDIYDYLVKVLAENETYVYEPTVIVGSPTEQQFNQILNYSLLSSINDKMIASINPDDKLEEETIKNNETIFDLSQMILKAFRNQQDRGKVGFTQVKKFIDLMLEKLSVKKDLRPIISKQIIKNASLDEFLTQMEVVLSEQLKFFSVEMERSER